jgi:LuxR family maltose regulon positive regulatory protein
MAQVRATRGDYDTARRLLDLAETMYRHGFYPDIRPIAATRTRVQIAEGDLPAAAQWVHDRGVSVDDDPDYLHEYEHLTLARLLLAQHRAEQRLGHSSPVTAVSVLLDRMHAAAADAGRDGSVLEIRTLQALAHHAHGDLPLALAVLGQSWVETPEPESYVRLYLDEGAPMLALLHHAADVAGVGHTGDGEGLRGRARRLLAQAENPVEEAEPHQPSVGPLSRRELQVLRLLDSELTGPEIARELYVSLNTLRTHTKRIFTKLGVTTRAAAVRRAHERGLL